MENAVRKAILSTATHQNKGAWATYPQDIAVSEGRAVQVERNLAGDLDFAARHRKAFDFPWHRPAAFRWRAVAAIQPREGLGLVAGHFHHLATAHHRDRRTGARLDRSEPRRILRVDANGLGPAIPHPDIEGGALNGHTRRGDPAKFRRRGIAGNQEYRGTNSKQGSHDTSGGRKG